MSGNGVLLPLPDDSRFQALIELWPNYLHFEYPRSLWLRDFEELLIGFYPQSSSRDRSLTARHYFPGYLSAGHNVP